MAIPSDFPTSPYAVLHMPSQIEHNRAGFEFMVRLHQETEDCFLGDVEIDMSETGWFDADMCAMFGALLYQLGNRLNNIKLTNISDDVKNILSRNGFLSHYGYESIPDYYGTTVSYKRFDVGDGRYFFKYVDEEFIQRSEMPEMSSGLLKKFHESIFEIFNNAVSHSGTELGIFSCGQFFPKSKRLDFTVVDLGVGIRENVRKYEGIDLSSEEAIDWATQGINTTKRGNVPGGLGLKLLCDFIDFNNGCIQIVSDAGYWKREERKTEKAALRHSFPGTAVNVEIRTDDTNSYALGSEVSSEDIF